MNRYRIPRSILGLFVYLYAVLAISQGVAASPAIVRGCINSFIAGDVPEGDVLGFSKGTVDEEVTKVVEASGLTLSDIVVLECVGSGSAHASVIVSEIANGKPGRFITYDPDWLRTVGGRDRWAVTTVIAHEVGHIANGHFAYVHQDLKEIETEADRFSGCIMGRLRGKWAAVAETLDRIRKDTDQQYPDRLQSLEAAREGFEACASEQVVEDNPPGVPLSREQRDAVLGLLGWAQSDVLNDSPNLKQLTTTYLTSLLNTDRFVYSTLLRNVLSFFQVDQGLEISGDLDTATIQAIEVLVSNNFAEPRYVPSEGTTLILTGCVTSDEISAAASIVGLSHLNMRGTQFCNSANESDTESLFDGFSRMIALEELILREASLSGFNILQELSKLPKLRFISLRETDVDDLSFLSALRSLEQLDLEQTKISDTDLTNLRNLTSLETLSLHGATNITDISVLGRLRRLKSLEISFTDVTDITPLLSSRLENLEAWEAPVKNFGRLAEIRTLSYLDARSDTLSSEDLAMLESHQSLEFLSLSQEWEGSDAVRNLRAARPDLSIAYDKEVAEAQSCDDLADGDLETWWELCRD